MDFHGLTRRYQYNAEFHALVEHFYRMFFENKFTFFEVKEALVFAKNKFDMENGTPFIVGK